VVELGAIREVRLAVPKQIAASHENNPVGQEHNPCALITLNVQACSKAELSSGRVVQLRGNRRVATCFQDLAARQERAP